MQASSQLSPSSKAALQELVARGRLQDLALVLGEYKAVFNISVAVEQAQRCSDPNIERGYRYTGAPCFAVTSYYRQPGTGYEIVGRIDESRYTTMQHRAAAERHHDAHQHLRS